MDGHFADRLLAAIERKGSPVCVGLDPVFERLPEELRRGAGDAEERVRRIVTFCERVLDVVAPIVAGVKPQSAHFEAYGAAGVKAYFDVVGMAQELGLVVIGDVKRNDIGPTAEAYAAGHLSGEDKPDAITINGYLGRDGLDPFVDVARREGKGVFVLVRTSNPSAAAVQDLACSDGRKLYEHMAAEVASLGDDEALIGTSGYSCVGAVVGATYPAEARGLRGIMPRQMFLVPGYGAQGAGASDCAAAFGPDGTGAIVNASRSVIFAYEQVFEASVSGVEVDWAGRIERAARAFAEEIRGAVGQ